MIEIGPVTWATVYYVATRVAEHALEQGAVAVFVDKDRMVRVLAHHDLDYDARVQRRAADLVGVYRSHPDYAQGRKQGWPIADDIRARLDELDGAMAKVA